MIVLDTVAHVSDAVFKQLKTMSEFAVEDFFPPVAIGETVEYACGDVRLLVAWPPLRKAHLFVCTQPGRRDSRTAAAAAASAAAATTPTAAAATAADTTSRHSRGRGGRRGWSRRVAVDRRAL